VTDEAPKKVRKPRPPKPTLVEQRLMAGALVLKTCSEDAPRGAFYVFTDNGRSARADIIEKLISAGKLRPRGDGLFGDDAQTWGYAA
jgi:hypothetical protein